MSDVALSTTHSAGSHETATSSRALPVLVAAGVPPGLGMLLPLDRILVKQNLELLEMFCACETNNSYFVCDIRGRPIYRVLERTGCCVRYCCGKNRMFTVVMDDYEGNEVVMSRSLACDCCPGCSCCCLEEVKVYSPRDALIGRVVQRCSCCFAKFSIKDHKGNKVLKIIAPCRKWSCICCCRDVKFAIYDRSGTEVGSVTKKWSGYIQEAMTDTDNYMITFPVDLDVRIKATLIAACILIDFMFFEEHANDGDQHNHN